MRTFTPDDLFALTWLGACAITPDGQRAAVVVTRLDREADCYRSTIWLVDATVGDCRQFTTGDGRDLAPQWSPDGKWLAFLRERQGEKPQLAVMPASGGEARILTTLPFGAGAPTWAPDSRRLAFAARTGTPPPPDTKQAKPLRRITQLKSRLNGEGWTYDRRRHLFAIDALVDRPTPQQITDGDWDDVQPAWSPDGTTLAFASARHDTRDLDSWADIWTVPVTGGPARKLTGTDAICAAPAWSPDGTRIAFLGKRHAVGENALVHVLPSGGGASIAIDPAFDRQCGVTAAGGAGAEPPVWLDDRRIACLAEDRGRQGLIIVSEGTPSAWLVAGTRTVQSASFAVGAPRVAFTASSSASPDELFVLDASTGAERRLTSFNEAWRDGVQVAVPERFAMETEAGVDVDTWVMKPAGYIEGRHYPVLLNVHGGPFTQYGDKFFDEFHVYTGAGYGIVFCNPRGSSGRSTAFGRAVVGRMGEPDYRDVMTAFEQALEQAPWADRSRLGVMGGSYGGFMTSWIIGHDHRFAAAISERAVNDWYSMQGTSDIGPHFNPAYLGDRAVIEDDVEAVLRQSPLTYAKFIRTPVLILHSEDDLRCPISQAEQLFVVLKRLGREVEFVRVPDENHELTRGGKPTHRVDRFAVILDFLSRRLAPRV